MCMLAYYYVKVFLNKFMLQILFHLNTQNISRYFVFDMAQQNKLGQSQNDIFKPKFCNICILEVS